MSKLTSEQKYKFLQSFGDVEITNQITTNIDNKIDGTEPLTADLSMGGNKLTDLALAVDGGDAVSKDYLDGVLVTPVDNEKSLSFDADETQSVNMGDTLSFSKTNPFSISLWFKTSILDYQSLVAKLDSESPYSGYEVLQVQNGAQTTTNFQLFDTDGNNIQIGTAFYTYADNLWHHCVATYDGSASSAGMKLYLDGKLNYVQVATGTLSADIENAIDFKLGERGGGDPGNQLPFTGSMDEVSIWNSTLDQADITLLYNAGSPTNLEEHPKAADLISWWRMGDSPDDETLIEDRIGSNDGTPVNIVNEDFTTDVP